MTPVLPTLSKVAVQMAALPVRRYVGHITNISNSVLRAGMRNARLGEICEVSRQDQSPLLAEVSALHGSEVVLLPYGALDGLQIGASVKSSGKSLSFDLGQGLLGRVIDAFGRPLDGKGPIIGTLQTRLIKSAPPPALSRPMVSIPLYSGLRVVDGLLALGTGQRIAIFGSPGTGKSSILSQIAQHTAADIVVIGLVGERGREVREFIERDLSPQARKKMVVVVATSDRIAIERSLCAHTATTVAEFFRDQGKSVLLMIDSLTRTARALREIGLSIGEAPTRRGYPSSVYPALPKIIERSGRSEKGDITAIYTVLTEGEGHADPIAEEVRSLTDGHITLSRKLAERGHFPAIDVLDSLSRIMPAIVPKSQQELALKLRRMLAKYDEIEMLLQIGEYQRGSDKEADAAIAAMPKIQAFLQQRQGNVREAGTIQRLMRELVQ